MGRVGLRGGEIGREVGRAVAAGAGEGGDSRSFESRRSTGATTTRRDPSSAAPRATPGSVPTRSARRPPSSFPPPRPGPTRPVNTREPKKCALCAPCGWGRGDRRPLTVPALVFHIPVFSRPQKGPSLGPRRRVPAPRPAPTLSTHDQRVPARGGLTGRVFGIFRPRPPHPHRDTRTGLGARVRDIRGRRRRRVGTRGRPGGTTNLPQTGLVKSKPTTPRRDRCGPSCPYASSSFCGENPLDAKALR